jgi:glycosyltransferase involved in cell wall biosynthesis
MALGFLNTSMIFKTSINEHVLKLIRRFKNYPLGILASELKAFLLKTPDEMSKLERKFVSCRPTTRPVGDVLLCYENRAFLLKAGDPFPIDHTNRWESWQIAKTFVDLGYCVDVINENNDSFVPTKNYSFFVGNRINFDRLAGLLNEECIKILHVDTSHWLFNNMAEYRRLDLLKNRRGFALIPDRYLTPNFAIERADYATVLGNDFTMSTYRHANKPLFRVPISSPTFYPWQEDKDFEQVRNHFLWFGSSGFVHKGLDLVLEAFVQMPEYHLTVCGPIRMDPVFESRYGKELYKTPNIHTVGWVDTASPEFLSIVEGCVGIVFPSCAEGQCGGVVTCLHAGLIPIISYESGVDVDETRGSILQSCCIDEIKAAAQRLSLLPSKQLQEMARRNVEFARTNHSRETFATSYSRAISEIMSAEIKKRQGEKNPVKTRAVSPELVIREML